MKPDTVVGAIAVVIATGRGQMTVSTDLMGDFVVKGDTVDDLAFGVDSEVLRKEVVAHLKGLAKALSRPDSDLVKLFKMEMQ